MTADSGFHSNVVVAAVEATGADAYIADRDYRKREPAFAPASRYKARDKKERGLRRRREREARESTEPKLFTVKDFIYSRWMGTIERVFGNIQNKGMRRFTLRAQKKVSAQRKLFTMVHNIEKVARVARR
ncbi:MAG TPA: transposase [Polyangiaceae bacterium]